MLGRSGVQKIGEVFMQNSFLFIYIPKFGDWPLSIDKKFSIAFCRF